ncbi:MAG: hypothetical protein K0S71_773 [Clostridia bacterium]|jgi:hypothetical protein|nr:hypothetical protein [Clostridia bacterium]
MKKICFINGSPKTGESCSLYMIDFITKRLEDHFKNYLIVNALSFLKHSNKESVFAEILSCDAIVVVFPLYVDSMPSHLLEMLENLDIYYRNHRINPFNPPCLYGLANCGFIEGHQNVNALKILRNYSSSAGFKWCGGLGLGGGEMIRSTKDQIPLQSKIALPIYQALCTLIESIKNLNAIEADTATLFANYNFPKWLFMFMANRFWITSAKSNGIAKKMMYVKPHIH